LHILGKLAIVGFVLFIIGIIWKVTMGIPLGIWVRPPRAWWLSGGLLLLFI